MEHPAFVCSVASWKENCRHVAFCTLCGPKPCMLFWQAAVQGGFWCTTLWLGRKCFVALDVLFEEMMWSMGKVFLRR
jgi:hypothetical protein